MYTQNTPVHVNLWHKDFWIMATANMLLTIAVYMQLFFIPGWMLKTLKSTPFEVALALGAFGIGVFSLGCFCSYLIQKYRRNVVCIRSIFSVALCLCILYYWNLRFSSSNNSFLFVVLIRFLEGAAFGLAQMILSSTLIIDKCESFQRTEANHSAAWFARFSLAIGPALSLITYQLRGFNATVAISLILCILSIFLILLVKFPFRAPDDNISPFSLDRFFLPRGKWLFLNSFIVASALGITFSIKQDFIFYAMMMIGFFLALLAQRFVFANAELKSEITTGIIFMAVAFLLMLSEEYKAIHYLSPTMLGCGYGIISARFLLFFIKLCQHCQRGTSQSTYFLSCESGISVGIFIGYAFTYQNESMAALIAIILLCIALVLYLTFVHNWYLKNKSR